MARLYLRNGVQAEAPFDLAQLRSLLEGELTWLRTAGPEGVLCLVNVHAASHVELSDDEAELVEQILAA